MTERLSGEEIYTNSIDTVSEDDSPTMYPQEVLNSINVSGISAHSLTLKKNCVIILLRNLNVIAGHCNGTRYLVKNISRYHILARRLDATEDEDDILIPRIPMHTKEGYFPFVLKHLQFPIKVEFGMIFNRSQGQSLVKCGIFLPRSVWTHGQLYVAFSRCGSPNGLQIWADTKNIVYTEVF